MPSNAEHIGAKAIIIRICNPELLVGPIYIFLLTRFVMSSGYNRKMIFLDFL